MNDRFKFRVFLKYNQIMCDIDSYCFLQGLNKCVFHFTNGGQKTLKNDYFILMQCTGLKDKNGKLIYDGDVVKQNKTMYCVTWEEGSYGFCDIRTKITYTVEYVMSKKQEVIGNIYENKELLDERN